MKHFLSDRINALEESATLAMAQKARELKAQGIDLISLSLGEPDFKTPKHIQEAAKQAIDDGSFFAYPPVAGYPDLRKAIADKLQKENNIKCGAENIVVSTGAKHSIANVFLCMLNPGDEVIIYSPYWVSYADMVKLAGGTPLFIKGGLEQDFKASTQQLEEAITSKTKIVIYSSPSNPTGSVFTLEELKDIAKVLSKHKNIFVIADEIYEYINFTGKHHSMASFPEMAENTITVNGFSKGHAMTGWRVGYIAAPVWIAKAVEKLQGQMTSGNSSIAQRAAYAAVIGDMQPTKDMAKQYLKRRDIVLELLNQIPGVKTSTPTGAFYVFPDISAYFGKKDGDVEIRTAEDFSMYILNKAHVSLVTGDAFGAPECVRISFAASEDHLREALKRMKDAMEKIY